MEPTRHGPGRRHPLAAILLLALALHGPLLLLKLPLSSYDASTHMFFAAHYAGDWWNPWNEKWYGGFTQTAYPPLAHQAIALLSFLAGMEWSYLLVQLAALLLLPLGVYRYARIWVAEEAAWLAALGAVFLGSLTLLAHQAGQLPTTLAAALLLNALPSVHAWVSAGRRADLAKAVALLTAAAASHHVTALFGIALFAAPVLWRAVADARQPRQPAGVPLGRVATGAGLTAAAIGLVLLPFFLTGLWTVTEQVPIPHASRSNYLAQLRTAMNYFLVPQGALLPAIPWILLRGSRERRLRPLFFGWLVTLLIGLGGTTPIAAFLLGTVPRALAEVDAFSILTFERFTFWATLMALPFAGLLAWRLLERHGRAAAVALGAAALATFGLAAAWAGYRHMQQPRFDIAPVVAFLNQEEHARYRYLTLGFGPQFANLSRQARAPSIDGNYNSARQLPELTRHGAAQLFSSKYFGEAGMGALRAVLARAQEYGLRYIFVRDPYYHPLLESMGWTRAQALGDGIVLWTRDDVPPAQPLSFLEPPPRWHGLLWGTLPVLAGLAALLATLLLREPRTEREPGAGPLALRAAK